MYAIKIVSGGQTGIDRAGSDAALEAGIPCGGWCPKGRRSEDGTIPEQYPLTETTVKNYQKRTEMNVTDSDATLIISEGKPTGGTALTIKLAQKYDKPYMVIDLLAVTDAASVKDWITSNAVHVLNVAGSRESKCIGAWSCFADDGHQDINRKAEKSRGQVARRHRRSI